MKLTLAVLSDICNDDLRTVKTVNASGKGISSLDDDLSPCVELRRLDLSKNKLTKTTALGDLKELSWLNLANNDLRALKGLSKLTNLI
eukprot:gene3122-8210_t